MPDVGNQTKDTPLSRAVQAVDLGRGADRFLKRLRESDEPLSLVRDLQPYDLLTVLSEADDEQRVELMTLADQDQLRGVIDLSCWPGDRPDLTAVAELIAPLAGSGLDGASKAHDDLGEELTTLLLKTHAKIHLKENKEDDVLAAEESELIPCPDGYYFIELPMPDEVPDVLRQLLAALLNRTFEEYQPELECVRHDLASELEELALRWRNGRLADLGFGTREEGLALLSPRDPEQVRSAIARATEAAHPLRAEARVPAIYRSNLDGSQLLDGAIATLLAAAEPLFAERADRLGAELGAMTSLFLTGVGCDLADPEAVARNVRAARDTLALGLHAVAGTDPRDGARALATQTPAVLIQAGIGLLAPLQARARRLLSHRRLALGGRRGALLDPPLRIAVDALALDLPRYWPPLDEGADLAPAPAEPLPDELAAFSSREQVDRAEALLAEAEHLPTLLFDGLGFGILPRWEGLTGSTLVLSAQASLAAEQNPILLPVPRAATEAFVTRTLATDEESACRAALEAIGPLVGVGVDGPTSPSDEPDPLRRLLLRLIVLGRARLGGSDPAMVLPVG
jgi:hypothetical protein